MKRLEKALTTLLDNPVIKIIMSHPIKTQCIIYGGFLRDTIADEKYKDIDIIVSPEFLQYCLNNNTDYNQGRDTRNDNKKPNVSKVFPFYEYWRTLEKYSDRVENWDSMMLYDDKLNRFDINAIRLEDINTDADINSLRVDMFAFKEWLNDTTRTLPVTSTIGVSLVNVINLIKNKRYNLVSKITKGSKGINRVHKLIIKGYKLNKNHENLNILKQIVEPVISNSVHYLNYDDKIGLIWIVEYIIENTKWINTNQKKIYLKNVIWKVVNAFGNKSTILKPIRKYQIWLQDEMEKEYYN